MEAHKHTAMNMSAHPVVREGLPPRKPLRCCLGLQTENSVKLGGPASYGSYAVAKRIGKLDQTLSLLGMRVLDLGCGNGSYTSELARRAGCVIGLDIQMSNLQAFRKPITRVQGVGENLPFAPESFEAVTMIEVLEHAECDKDVLSECFRILRPGGFLILFVPNKLYPMESHPCHVGRVSIGHNVPFASWLPESIHRRICHARIYSRRRLLSMACRAGFQIRNLGYIFPPLDSFPLPFKHAYRRLAWRLEETPLGMFGVSIFSVFEKPKR